MMKPNSTYDLHNNMLMAVSGLCLLSFHPLLHILHHLLSCMCRLVPNGRDYSLRLQTLHKLLEFSETAVFAVRDTYMYQQCIV